MILTSKGILFSLEDVAKVAKTSVNNANLVADGILENEADDNFLFKNLFSDIENEELEKEKLIGVFLMNFEAFDYLVRRVCLYVSNYEDGGLEK